MTQKCTCAVQSCKDEVRKAKASLELNLARDVNSNKKGFYKYMNSKGETREAVGALLLRAGELKLDLPNHFSVVLVRWKGLRRLEVSLGYTHLQEGSEGGSRKPQTHLWLWPWCHGRSWGTLSGVLSWSICRTPW